MKEQELVNDIINKIKKIGEWKHRGALMDIKKVVYDQLRKPENKDNFVLNFLDFYISGLYVGLGYYYELKEREEGGSSNQTHTSQGGLTGDGGSQSEKGITASCNKRVPSTASYHTPEEIDSKKSVVFAPSGDIISDKAKDIFRKMVEHASGSEPSKSVWFDAERLKQVLTEEFSDTQSPKEEGGSL